MSHRYAVLWETAPEHRARPAGLVVEQDDHVLVEARDELGLPRRYAQPFEVRGPDFTSVQYTPADAQYFDQVLLDLSRGFVIGKEGRVNKATHGTILRLLGDLVFRPLRREHVVVWHNTVNAYPTVRAYQQYLHEDSPAEAADQAAPQHEAASSLCLVA